jgi:hypothetical protein
MIFDHIKTPELAGAFIRESQGYFLAVFLLAAVLRFGAARFTVFLAAFLGAAFFTTLFTAFFLGAALFTARFGAAFFFVGIIFYYDACASLNE